MSVRQSLLALLADGPRHGYQLKTDFESRTGGAWPLNVGQVYTTLARLERDGLVANDGEDAEARVVYRITEDGRAALAAWWATAVAREGRPRDELVIKLAIALTVPGVDVAAVVQAQRADTIRALQSYTQLKARADEGDVAWLLVLENHLFQAEAEIRWLDHCEATLASRAVPAPTRRRQEARS